MEAISKTPVEAQQQSCEQVAHLAPASDVVRPMRGDKTPEEERWGDQAPEAERWGVHEGGYSAKAGAWGDLVTRSCGNLVMPSMPSTCNVVSSS